MLSARIKILTVVYILILVGIIVLADLNGTNYFSFIRYIPYGDKIGHFCLMGMFSLLVNLVLKAKTIRLWKFSYLLGSLIVAGVVLVEEFSQKYVGGRTFDLVDLLFDFAGIIVFGEIARLMCRKRVRS
jgi:polysaccharide biosynthesis protein VpsQ